MPALAPRASLQLLSFSPPSLPFTHSSSLLCPPTDTLSAHEPGPVQPPAAGGPRHGEGRALPSSAPRDCLWGRGERRARAPLCWGGHAGWGPPRSELGREEGAQPKPCLASPHPQHRRHAPGEVPAPGGPAVPGEGNGSPLVWDEPQACAQRGKGPVGGSRTCCWDRPALHGAGPGHHLLPRAPPTCPVPPSCRPPALA